MKLTVAVLDKQGNNTLPTVLDLLGSFDVGQVSHFGLVSPAKGLFEKSLGVLNRQGIDASTLIGCISSKSLSSSSYDFLQLDDAALLFEGKTYTSIPKTSITEQIAKTPAHCESQLQTLLGQADGDYCLLMVKDGWIAAGRDPIGIQPLYFGENKDIAAFATNRKALWRLGIENPQSFPPGNLAYLDKTGFKFKPIKTLTQTAPKPVAIAEASKTVQSLLEQSIERRVHGLKEVSVAFSGGLDSSMVAFFAKKLGVKVHLVHVSLENQPETEEAIASAEALDLPLQIHLFKESDVENTLPKVVELIEEPDPIKASIGVPFYWVAQKASEAGFKVMLAGQGADELFGGYQRYVKEYCRDGDKVLQTMFGDVVKLYESNLERDLKITGFFDVDLRLPFGAFDLAEYALSLPLECKFEQKPDTLRKLVLRKLAVDAGMPKQIADKPKKAVQYSTGINDAVKRIAKKQQKTVNQYIGELFEQSKAR